MTNQLLTDAAAVDAFLRTGDMCAVYFTGADCGVCKALKPKLVEMLAERFPQLVFGEVDCAETPDLAAMHSVFTVPTLIVFTRGKESLRRSRSFGIGELAAQLERPYSLLFD